MDNPDDLPPRPGESIRSMGVDSEIKGTCLVFHEMTGNADGDAWLGCPVSDLIEDPDGRGRNL